MLKSLMLSSWINPDLTDQPNYSASYGIAADDEVLYTINLNQRGGFYQISEFVSERGAPNFVLEQINKTGRSKVVVYDKDSGHMLGQIGEATLLDDAGDASLKLCHVEDLNDYARDRFYEASEQDWVVIEANTGEQLALIACAPPSARLWPKLKMWLSSRTHRPEPAMRIDIALRLPVDERLLYATSVVLHSRTGIPERNRPQLPTDRTARSATQLRH